MGAKSSFQSRRDAGVTLMEMIAALAIISIIVVGALALYESARSSEEATQLISDAMAVQTAVRNVYMGQQNYGDDSDALQMLMWRSKKLPTTIKGKIDSSGKVSLTHHLGGKLALSAMHERFVIIFSGVPSDVCIPVLSMTGSDWEEVTIGNDTDGVLNEFPPGYFPLSPREAEGYCVSSDSLEIGFYSKQYSPR